MQDLLWTLEVLSPEISWGNDKEEGDGEDGDAGPAADLHKTSGHHFSAAPAGTRVDAPDLSAQGIRHTRCPLTGCLAVAD